MPLSKEMRLLESKWRSGQGWPKRLEWIEIENIRGWIGERIEFQFPIVALVGENGVGKSTVLQAVAASYKAARNSEPRYASDFFPDTPWEDVMEAEIRTSIREGVTSGSLMTSVRKPTERWRGNEARKERYVEYVDLRRIQPIGARTGYARMAKRDVNETEVEQFDDPTLKRLSGIMGRDYDGAKFSLTDVDDHRFVPVISKHERWYSGFHGGAGETALAELLRLRLPQYAILLIDEIETSMHPRTQRRLMRDLANTCRRDEIQCILSTHSPYVLDELPPEGRIYMMESEGQRKIIVGVSPAFAMTKMDDEVYPEADVYVEDDRSATLVNEMVAKSRQRELVSRYQIIPYGPANVGRSLGTMAHFRRFPRPSLVLLDGEQSASEGCLILPGGDSPERVIFEALRGTHADRIGERLSRSPSDVAETMRAAMLLSDHHEWVKFAADRLAVTGDVLWQAMCAEWCLQCLSEEERDRIGDALASVIVDYGGTRHVQRPAIPVQTNMGFRTS